MMIRLTRIAVVCFIPLSLSFGLSARAQQPNAGGTAAAEEAGIGDIDFSLIFPVDVGTSNVNGPTDRFGMPLVGPFLKGVPSEEMTHDEDDPPLKNTNPKRSQAKKNSPAAKSVTTKGKEPRKGSRRTSSTTSGTAPGFFVPHGSLEWTPSESRLSTSPSSPYGYGYGTSGYGTEVFGDFWMGWPMVE